MAYDKWIRLRAFINAAWGALVRDLKTKAFIVIVAWLALQPLEVNAQFALDVHGIDFTLGMERQVVLTKLKAYLVQCAGEPNRALSECNSLLVLSKQRPHDVYANILLQGGKVKSVLKYWDSGYEGSKPWRFVQTLYALLASASQQPTPFQVSVAERRDPGSVQQTIFLTSSRRTICISYAEGLRGADGKTIPSFVNLYESVGLDY